MKSYVMLILILVVMISIIIFALVISFSPSQIKNGIETYAEISDFKSVSSSGRRSVFTYKVDGLNYNLWGYYNNTLVRGDKFIIKYKESKPTNATILLDRPVFLENEQTTETVGEIVRLILFLNRELYFEYAVNGVIYTRIQKVPKDYKSLYPKLSVGQKFRVIYWNENPRRAIIKLNTPVN